jgi:uncharacterized protein YbjT (DUF2867 family)
LLLLPSFLGASSTRPEQSKRGSAPNEMQESGNPASTPEKCERGATLTRCLVTGATGYIGSRLIPVLLDRGLDVRALARTPEKLTDVPWHDNVEIARGDLGDPSSLVDAFEQVDVVYYLVHSMGTEANFADAERRAAQNVASAAGRTGVARIVYLSGLHPAGSGSASFEMIRHLTDRLPVMTTPKWVHNTIQPIAVSDVLYYLAEAATADFPASRTWDIGGPDVLEYGEMMQGYAQTAGLRRRRIVVLPWLTPTIASWWVGLVTPIPAGLARPLVESLHCDAVVDEHDIDAVIAPLDGGLTPYLLSVQLALDHSQQGRFEPAWTDSPADPLPSDPSWSGEPVRIDSESTTSPNDAAAVRATLSAAASRRWRPRTAEAKDVLLLKDSGRVPGDAWLEVTVTPAPDAGSAVEYRTMLRSSGLPGRVYAATVWPIRRKLLHRRVSRLLRS